MDQEPHDAPPGGPPSPVGPRPDGAPPPPPPPPAAPAPAPLPVAPAVPGWLPPPEAAGHRRLELGSILGRTFDTFGREWSLFLVLAVPAALASLLQVLVIPAFDMSFARGAARTVAFTDPLALLVVSLVGVTLSGITALACSVVTDRLWRGQPAGPSDGVIGVARCLRRAVPVWLLVLLFEAVISLPVVLIGTPNPDNPPSQGALIVIGLLFLVAIPLLFVLGIVALWIGVRLSLIIAVIALEEGPPLGAIGRTWRLTRGSTIVLLGLWLVIGLCSVLISWGASLFIVFGQNRLIAGIALALASLVTAPLIGIWTTIAWGDLVGGRHADSALMARGRGRWTTAAFLGGLSVVLLVAGIGIAGETLSRFLALR